MSIVRIVGKRFKLAPQWKRLCAFLLDIGLLGFCQTILMALSFVFGRILDDVFDFYRADEITTNTLIFLSFVLWIFGLFFLDGVKKGGGFGKRLLSLQIVRLKDGAPGNFKDAFIRRFSGIFQPIDWLFALGKERQRMGDKLAKTVVVQLDSPFIEMVPESEAESESKQENEEEEKDLEKVLENVILEITNRFSEAKQKVDASIGIEKQFQNAHDGAISQAAKCQERAVISLKAGREDLAREDLAQRNEYRQIANRYKEQWEEQKKTVEHLTTLLDTLQQKTQQTQREREVVIAKHRNVDAQEHLQQTLS